MAKGRPRLKGKRGKDGRRILSPDDKRVPPSEFAQARQERFRHFRGDGSIGHEMTCAGRLMLVGAFDGLEVPAETILNHIHRYTLGYWSYYTGLEPKTGAYERSDRSQDSSWDDPRGERFDAMDAALRSAGHAAKEAVHDVSISRHWFPDEDVEWAARIINSRIVQKREQLRKANMRIPDELAVAGELACDSDWAMLDLLRHGAMALVQGKGMRRAA